MIALFMTPPSMDDACASILEGLAVHAELPPLAPRPQNPPQAHALATVVSVWKSFGALSDARILGASALNFN
jgi:hypothetical protein